MKMNVGDLVKFKYFQKQRWASVLEPDTSLGCVKIIFLDTGEVRSVFNKRGEGGKHFVHVLSDNKVNIIFYIDIEVISSC